MSDRTFFDTNVLIYMYDQRDQPKRRAAADAFRSCVESATLVISTQVVQEFYVSVTRKLGLPPGEARPLVKDLCELPLVVVDAPEIQRALEKEQRFHLSFWDALILAAAETAGATSILSEHFSHERSYGGIRVVNPFRTQ